MFRRFRRDFDVTSRDRGAWILPRNIVKYYFDALETWLSDVEGNITYKICINQAALNWKSPLVLALMGF